MEKWYGKKDGDKKPKLIIGLLAILIIVLVLLVIDVTNSEEESPPGSGIKKVFREIAEDVKTEKKSSASGTDSDSEIDSESDSDSDADSGDEEEERTELMSADKAQELVQQTEDGEYVEDKSYTEGEITCDEISLFSGQFVEDGRDELVENVAAILVTNHSDKFLELATLIYDIDGETATFVATGIPAGKSAWVMEKSRMVISGDAKFTYQGSTTSYKENVVASTDKIEITADANMLTAVNNTDEAMENIVVYYKVLHDDGNYFGGITYVVDFGSVGAGESAETLAGHYQEGSTEIVRISWQ